ncbi:Epidermal growth factor receptor kinase substrate 8-like protein 2 [Clonorchis sinensis]|uniref:Epidermal growth factor receptor kinase substrate 8-like protein 2 n=1 Tax=Clonorchis sinensis TaxID=79923 RepID=A0A3R7EMD7_CLOSI|nr:Epidermal growth factor receptor kinase substrate 8-like protein 2 [Clonorchis sinensis]
MGEKTNGQVCVKFEVEHVKTFTSSPTSPLINMADAIELLKNQTKGERIRVQMIIEEDANEKSLLIVEQNQELERFPLSTIRSLSFKSDSLAGENNNMILFQIDAKSLPNGEPEHNELHAFQILEVPAQLVVEAINEAKGGERKFSNIPVLICPEMDDNSAPKPSFSGSIGDSYSRDDRTINLQAPTVSSKKMVTATRPEEVDTDFIRAEVQLLNHLFDDIESALQEMRDRPLKMVRRSSAIMAKTGTSSKSFPHTLGKTKSDGHGKQMDPKFRATIVDFYQKVKLSAIILSRLLNYVKEPNSPQLVRQLFVLLKEALTLCRDPKTGQVAVAREAIRPWFPSETLTFLQDNLSNEQLSMLKDLGPAWNTPREESDNNTVYVPQFRHNFQIVIDDYEPTLFRFNEKGLQVDPQHRYIRAAPLNTFARQLMLQKAHMAKVIANFRAKNERELSVEVGEYLELLNTSEDWRKVRNSRNEIGFCPNVVLRVIEHRQSKTSVVGIEPKKSASAFYV